MKRPLTYKGLLPDRKMPENKKMFDSISKSYPVLSTNNRQLLMLALIFYEICGREGANGIWIITNGPLSRGKMNDWESSRNAPDQVNI